MTQSFNQANLSIKSRLTTCYQEALFEFWVKVKILKSWKRTLWSKANISSLTGPNLTKLLLQKSSLFITPYFLLIISKFRLPETLKVKKTLFITHNELL